MNKILKNVVPLLLSGIFVSGVTVYGQEITLENIISKNVNLIEERSLIPDEYSLSFYSITGEGLDSEGAKFWLVWDTDNYEENDDEVLITKKIDVSIIDDFIISYYKDGIQSCSTNDDDRASISKAEAKTKAMEWIKNTNPDYYENIIISNDVYNPYHFKLNYSKDGIPVYGVNGSIGVSQKDGDIESYRLPYLDTSNYPNSIGVISEDEAMETYASKIGIKPVYMSYIDKDEKIKAFIGYIENKKGYAVDANSGNLIELENKILMPRFEYDDGVDQSYLLSEIDTEEFEKFYGDSSIISLEDATNIILNDKNLNLSKDIEITSTSLALNLYKEYLNEKRYFISFYFREKQDEDYSYNSVLLDATTGEIVQYSKFYYYSGDGLKEDINVYRKRAEEIFKNLAGDKSKEFVLQPTYKDLDYGNSYLNRDTISFYFKRVVNGIEFPEDNYTITLNAENELVGYHGIYSDIPFEDIGDMVSKEEALESLFKTNKLKKYYLPDQLEKESSLVNIVYILENSNYIINAKTGKVVDRNNK